MCVCVCAVGLVLLELDENELLVSKQKLQSSNKGRLCQQEREEELFQLIREAEWHGGVLRPLRVILNSPVNICFNYQLPVYSQSVPSLYLKTLDEVLNATNIINQHL